MQGGHKCVACAGIEKQDGYYHSEEWRHCTDCKQCEECRLNLHKESLPHPSKPHQKGKLTRYCTIRYNEETGKNTVWMKINSLTGMSFYLDADDKTKAVICDHLDKYGVLIKSGVPLPPNYWRRMKYLRRDAPPVLRTSKRPAGHKQETITCPIMKCQDRTCSCQCQCPICKGDRDYCKCCITCQSMEEKCTCQDP